MEEKNSFVSIPIKMHPEMLIAMPDFDKKIIEHEQQSDYSLNDQSFD